MLQASMLGKEIGEPPGLDEGGQLKIEDQLLAKFDVSLKSILSSFARVTRHSASRHFDL